MGEFVLVLEDVWKGFERGGQRVPVLEGASLTVASREVVSVVGTRDQGKTTLLKVAAGVESPDRGSVRIGSLELAGLKDRELSEVLRTEIGLAARDGPGMRVRMREYVGLQLAAGRRWQRRERTLRVAESLERLDVGDCAGLRWGEMSNWQRARVELAQAIAPRPRLLLVDDLLDGLGLGKTQEATQLVRELAQEIGCGVLMAVSDHATALPSDRVWELHHGKLSLMVDHTVPQLTTIHQQPSAEQAARRRRRH